MHQLTDSGLPSTSVTSSGNAVLPAAFTDVPYTGIPDGAAEQELGGLVACWRMLQRRKGTLLILGALGGVMGLLVALPQTPIYQARTSMEVVNLNQNFLNLKENTPVEESSDTEDIQTQIKILQSDALLNRVMTKLHSTPLPPVPRSRVDALRQALHLPAPEIDPREAALLIARYSLKVQSAGDTRIIEARVDSPSPQIAALFANALSNEFIDQSIEARWKASEHTGEWLAKQLDDERNRLEQSENRLQQYANQAGLIFTDNDKTNVSEERLSQVQQALTAAQTDRILKQSRLEMAESSPADALPDILSDANLRDYDSKLTELNRQLAELRTTYKDDYPKVQRVLAQIQPIRAARQQAQADIMLRIHNEYDEAIRREKLLAADYASQRAVVTGESEKAIQYNILKREVESNRQLYDAMLQQLKQSSLASALRASNVRVVDPAVPPEHPYKPDMVFNVILGLISGLMLGAAFVIVGERADRSIQEPGETQQFLNLPELGIIPSDDMSSRVKLRFAASKQLEGPEDPTEPRLHRTELVAWNRNSSVVAESFRAALVSILFSGENGSRPRVMVVTSTSPAEGKSTVVSNLGIAIAEINQKILLIDADLRKPRLHDIFSLKNDKGLSDLLRSRDPMAELLEGAIQETGVPDLYVLPSGPTTNAATSLLYSNRMPELLRMLRMEFETILIDTPPMLHIPDARVVGRVVDSVIMVVRASKTTRAAALAARQRFREDGTKMLGTILNDWNPRNAPNGYYGKYAGYGAYKNGYGYGEGYFGDRKRKN